MPKDLAADDGKQAVADNQKNTEIAKIFASIDTEKPTICEIHNLNIINADRFAMPVTKLNASFDWKLVTPNEDGKPVVTSCKSSGMMASITCNVLTAMPGLQSAFSAGSGGGDPKKACEDAEKLSKIAMGINATFGATCGLQAGKCSSDCTTLSGELGKLEAQAGDLKETYIRQVEDSWKTPALTKMDGYCRKKANDDSESCGMAGESAAQCKEIEDGVYNSCLEGIRSQVNSKAEECRTKISRSHSSVSSKITSRKSETDRKIASCEMLGGQAGQALVQGLQNYASMQQAKACQDFYADRDCKSLTDLQTKPQQCKPILCDCVSGQYRNYAECSDFKCELDCTKPENFGSQICLCQKNPSDPGCPGNTANNPYLPGGGNNPYGDVNPGGVITETAGGDLALPDGTVRNIIGGIDGPPDSNPFAGDDDKNNGNGQQMQPGSPFAGGGGFQGNPDKGGKGGQGKGPHNTDILGSAAGPGSGAFGGGAYPFGGGADGNGQKGFNLKDFLPGGKGAERAIASQAELEKNGVSSANGLSNFQKVTRQVNDMRRQRQFMDNQP